MPKPLVSVLVPAYNDGRFLDQALASIAGQTLTDFEVIIADDGSADDSLAIASRWASRDRRFRLVSNGRNLGMTANWNRALREARGDYVAKLDADDAMRPRCLEILAEEMKTHPELIVAYCRTLSCDEALQPFASYLGDTGFIRAGLNPLQRYVRAGHDWFALCFADVQLWHSNAQLHRRERLLALGGWDETWGCASDTDLILRVLEQDGPVCHQPYAGILYRHRERSVSDTFRKHGWLRWEGTLIHLLSLTRYYRAGHPIALPLRKAWWLSWRQYRTLLTQPDADLSQFPEPVRSRLSQAVAALQPPPFRIRAEGWTRQQLWRVKQAFQRNRRPLR